METNNWETVHDTEQKRMIHFFENKNYMIVTDFKKSSADIIDLTNRTASTTIDISKYSVDQYAELVSSVCEKDRNYNVTG